MNSLSKSVYLPFPLGEGRGEGLTCHHTLPLIPLPNGEGRIRKKPSRKPDHLDVVDFIYLSGKGREWSLSPSPIGRGQGRGLDAPSHPPLFPLPSGEGRIRRSRPANQTHLGVVDFISLSHWESEGETALHLPLPLGEGRGEGLTSHHPFPSFPSPAGREIRKKLRKPNSLGCSDLSRA